MTHLKRTKQDFDTTIEGQGDKGLITYGQPLDPLEPRRNLGRMTKEELADAYTYVVAFEDRIDFAINKIKKLTDDPEIDHWLDFMRGE